MLLILAAVSAAFAIANYATGSPVWATAQLAAAALAVAMHRADRKAGR